ncbi:hypothetical protein P3S67_000072 [Capsicum chacoense]
MADAAVVSLQQKLHEMLVDENFWFVMLDKNFRFLREVVSFWHAFLEDSLSKRNAPEAVEHLESQVKYLGTQLLDRINLYELEKRSPDFNPLNSKVFPDYMTTMQMRSRWEDRLKPCFLYMGAFPKNFEISVSRLIKLWIAAEFVKCTPEKDFEEVAEGYLSDLIDRSLIMVKKRTSGGKVKTYRDGTPGSCYQIDPFISFTNFVFSTVLDMCFQPFDHLPSEIWKLYSLRYLALASFDVLPPSVRYLSCLQTLIRYSQQKCCYFCDELEDYVVWLSSFDLALTKMQTLSYITFGSITKSVVEGIPNLKNVKFKACIPFLRFDGVKGQVESLHRELSLTKAFLKVSREKRSELPNSFNF